jgi:iron complex outermembrane receptor protein
MVLHKNKITIAIAIASAALVSPITVAQNGYMLEEVVVTATKRSENLQDVAVAVTAISGDILRQARIFDSQDLVKLTPSLTFQDGGDARASSFNIRGIGTQSYSSGVEPSVSTVVDGVVMGRSGMGFAQMMDLKRVEVLRGPQGMLFGKNASAGVVHLISNDPGEEFEADVHVNANSDDYRINAMVSLPLTDTLGLRIAAIHSDTEGHIKNLANGKYINGSKNDAVRAKLLWQASDDLEIKFSIDKAETKGECCQFQSRSSNNINIPTFGSQEQAMAPLVGSKNNRDVNIGADLFSNSKSSGSSLEINWAIGEYTLTSITAVRNWEHHNNIDVDGTPDIWLDLNEGESDQDQFTQELRLASPSEDTISYVIGAYYFDQDIDRRFARDLYVGLPNPATNSDGVNFSGAFDASVATTNYAFFGQLTGTISDSLRLIAGARYTNDELGFEFERTGSLIQNNAFIGPQPTFKAPTSEDSDVAYKLGVQWDVSDDIMAYATWTEGYKGPAYNVVFEMSSDTPPKDAETSESFEVGFKSNLFDNRLRLNVAAFHTVYSNFQSQAQDATTGTFQLLGIGDVETQGLEVDFQARPMKNLDIFGGFAYIDTEIKDLSAGQCAPIQIANAVSNCALDGTQDVRGESMPQAPELKFTLASAYLIETDDLPVNFSVNAAYRWQDDTLYALDQDENKVQKAYGVLDLSLDVLDKEQRFAVSVYIDNVLDKEYVSTIIQNNIFSNANNGSFPYDHYLPRAAERIVGLEVNYSWF